MSEPFHVGDIVVETQTYSLLHVCTVCGVHADRVVELVSFGIIVPLGAQPEIWQFPESALHRAKKALRLHRDFGLDQQGLGLVLDLLDEVERLQAQVARLQR